MPVLFRKPPPLPHALVDPLHDLVLEIDEPFFVPPPVRGGIAESGKSDDVNFDGEVAEPLLISVADAAAREKFGDDGDGSRLMFETPFPRHGDFIPGTGDAVTKSEDGFTRNFQPIEDGETDFVIIGPKPHFDGGHLLGFEDTKAFRTTREKEVRRAERACVKTASGDEDKINAFEV
jgi:hypothetical protein